MTDLFNPVASDVDASCLNHLRFTSSVLAEDMEVTGICTVELQLQLQLASGAASTAAAGPIGADSSHTHGGSPGHGHGPGHGPGHGYGHGPGDGASLRGLGHTDLDRNGDVYVSLQCVQENGSAAYVTEGCLRLKHRKFELAANLLRRGLSASQAALERIPHQLPAPSSCDPRDGGHNDRLFADAACGLDDGALCVDGDDDRMCVGDHRAPAGQPRGRLAR